MPLRVRRVRTASRPSGRHPARRSAPVAPPPDSHLLTRMVDAVLVEWEGVLADTFIARRDALARALADEGVRMDDAAIAAACQGRSTHSAAAAVLMRAGHEDPTLTDLVSMRAARGFAERLGKGFVLLPGARDFMECAQSSAPVGIVTCASRSETEFVLELAGLAGTVSTIVSADDALDDPPSAAMFELGLERKSVV